MKYPILFFADKLTPMIGGVEIHGKYFIDYFLNHPTFPLSAVISKNAYNEDCIVTANGLEPIDLSINTDFANPAIVFFNSGRWIEQLKNLRQLYPQAYFVYRTGGNEIVKAPLSDLKISDHSARQQYWANTLNNTIDLLITNSSFTEQRLRQQGIKCSFARCVGGVNTSSLKMKRKTSSDVTTIFCAARFVPYKNHLLMLKVIAGLIQGGHSLKVRLAGDGPELEKAQQLVRSLHLESIVTFLGPLDNTTICEEIALSDLYMQLSTDYLTQVPGGSYIHTEGMGRTILEAITAGTFVIAGKSGALSEIVTKDRGILIELNHLEDIIETLDQLLKKPLPSGTLTDIYSWSTLFKRYEKLWTFC